MPHQRLNTSITDGQGLPVASFLIWLGLNRESTGGVFMSQGSSDPRLARPS